MKDRREYVQITTDLPENPKLADADPRAKWLYVVAVCFAGQHLTDGHVHVAQVLAKARVPRRWLADLTGSGALHEPGHDCDDCAQPRRGSVIIHDYLRHQRSRHEALLSRASKSKGAELTNHKRWHSEPDPTCRYCDRSSDQSTESLQRSLRGRSAIAEVEVEGESGLGSQSGVDRTDSQETDFAKIAQELGQSQAWARRVVTDVLKRASRPPGDVTKYVLSAIRSEPARYQPTPGPPPLARLCDHGRDRLICPDCAEETA